MNRLDFNRKKKKILQGFIYGNTSKLYFFFSFTKKKPSNAFKEKKIFQLFLLEQRVNARKVLFLSLFFLFLFKHIDIKKRTFNSMVNESDLLTISWLYEAGSIILSVSF